MVNQQLGLITVETDLLNNRVNLVSMDDRALFADRSRLNQLRSTIERALKHGCQRVSVPRQWFHDLETAYIYSFSEAS